jgi:hypothetical protein
MGSVVSRRALMQNAARAATLAVAVTVAPVLGRKAVATAAAPPPTFYVSSTGNDGADGVTPETAWASIQKANSALPPNSSTVLFRRGETFYGELVPPFGCEVGAYGPGSKPVLTMFKLLTRPDGWTEDSAGVWKIDLGSPSTHDGYTATANANIGYLVTDGTVQPALKGQLSDLSAPWDFYCDIGKNTLYVAASANPTTLAADIKAAPKGDIGRVIYCKQGSNDIHDVHVTGTGGCGIGGIAPDVHIHDCLIDYIGGSILDSANNPRYGNGIENWVDVKRWLIEDNEIAEVYDVAWSPQGRAGADGSWEDMTVRNNYIHDCNQSFEFWSTGSNSAGGFKRILVEGNLCERAGYSVFSDVRPDQDTRVHLLTYHWDTPADITIQDNTFNDAHGAYSYHPWDPVGYVTRNNTIRLRPGQKMQFQYPDTVEEAAEWQALTGREVGSTFEVL